MTDDKLYIESDIKCMDGSTITCNNGGVKEEYIKVTQQNDGWVRVQGFLKVDNDYIQELLSKYGE
jgi:hypothetical protein